MVWTDTVTRTGWPYPQFPDEPMNRGHLKLFSGSAHPALASEIAEFLGVSMGQARLFRFPDTEVSFQIDENIRGTDVFVVQPTCAPVDQSLIELCVMIDAFRRSSARRITAVIPYYGYARQDRKDKPRVPISAKLVANLLSAAGTNRVLTMDLHKAQIQGFFDIPVDHLFAAPVIIDHCRASDHSDADDRVAGRRRRGTGASLRQTPRCRAGDHRQTAQRRWHGGSDERHWRRPAGEPASSRTTSSTRRALSSRRRSALKENGAERVLACAVHGVLSGPAIERLEAAPIDQVIITNTIPLNSERARCCKKIKQLSVARLLGQAIRSIHEETSVSSLFV